MNLTAVLREPRKKELEKVGDRLPSYIQLSQDFLLPLWSFPCRRYAAQILRRINKEKQTEESLLSLFPFSPSAVLYVHDIPAGRGAIFRPPSVCPDGLPAPLAQTNLRRLGRQRFHHTEIANALQ